MYQYNVPSRFEPWRGFKLETSLKDELFWRRGIISHVELYITYSMLLFSVDKDQCVSFEYSYPIDRDFGRVRDVERRIQSGWVLYSFIC